MRSDERSGVRIPKGALPFLLWWAGVNASWWSICSIDVGQPVLLSLCFGVFTVIMLIGGALVAVSWYLTSEGAESWVVKLLIAFLFVVVSFLILFSVLLPPPLQGFILVVDVLAVLASGLLYWRMRKAVSQNQEG